MQRRILSSLLALAALTAPIAVAEPSDDPSPWTIPAGSLHAIVQPIGYDFNDETPPEGIWIAISSGLFDPTIHAILFASQHAEDCEIVTNNGTEWSRTAFIFIASECTTLNLDAPDSLKTASYATWWYSTSAVVYYNGPCAVLMPGVDLDQKPPVFVYFQPECLEPYISGPDVEADWRWR